jgi:trigger factor
LKKTAEIFLNMLYPKKCPMCHQILKQKNSLICSGCAGKIRPNVEPLCKKCGRPVKTEEEYFAKLREMIAHQLVPESDYKFSIDARAAIEKAVGEFDLPDAFLKRWLLATDKNRKAENIDEDFAKMVPDLKWQLIKEQIVKQFDIHVDDADLLALAKRVAASQFAQYGMTGVPDDVLERYAREMLSSKESRSRLIDQATEQKIQTAIKESVTLTDKEVTMDKFQKMFEVAE